MNSKFVPALVAFAISLSGCSAIESVNRMNYPDQYAEETTAPIDDTAFDVYEAEEFPEEVPEAVAVVSEEAELDAVVTTPDATLGSAEVSGEDADNPTSESVSMGSTPDVAKPDQAPAAVASKPSAPNAAEVAVAKPAPAKPKRRLMSFFKFDNISAEDRAEAVCAGASAGAKPGCISKVKALPSDQAYGLYAQGKLP
ncbi:hypothetical protein A3709_18795 [Halioglobus sp. HI00S01]|uniref:hypothetical protein n=1 Tax=Halioglobus sp. HI00S01 TaxID=1822214 RepID=UPI0007C29C4E|nr:hypothetical protein [Halioglobus sp. HI00S01]KZX57673.1 hypothetical protein A3709_18795 [Halioglobus sp. HI00S01]